MLELVQYAVGRVGEWDLPATINNAFRGQAGTAYNIYISSSSNLSERNKSIELIHPEGRRGHNVTSFLLVCASQNVASSSPNSKPGGQLVEHVLGANSMLEQPVTLLAK